MLGAPVDRVEEGSASDSFEGTEFMNGTVAHGVAFKRQSCN